MDIQEFLIVGLGNPGARYEKTRHNLGFMVLEALAKKYALSFKREERIHGKVASGSVGEKSVHLLMPSTYMNLSGTAINRALHYYKLVIEQLLVVVDDVYLKFGTMRLREEGGTGGHNGLKNIQTCLGTQKYARLRMGIGPVEENLFPDGYNTMPLEEYVLANFTSHENKILTRFIENSVSVIEEWLKLGIGSASVLAGNLSIVDSI